MFKLPCELLQTIFSYLDGDTIDICRVVSRGWRSAVDGLPDSTWRRICQYEFNPEDYIEGRKEYGPSWRNTYRALNSWSNVGHARIDIQQRTLNAILHFKVLANGVVACFQRNRVQSSVGGASDTILFYDLETLKEQSREEFDFVFSTARVELSMQFVVFVTATNQLCIILRSNKKQFCVGEIGELDNFTILGSEVYFRSLDDHIIYVSKLVIDGGEYAIMTVPLEGLSDNPFEYNIFEFGYKEGDTNMLTILTIDSIYVYNKEQASYCLDVQIGAGDDLAHVCFIMQKYGFVCKSRHDLKTECTSRSLISVEVGNNISSHYSPLDRMTIFSTNLYGKERLYSPTHYINELWVKNNECLGPYITTFMIRDVGPLDEVATATSNNILVLRGKKLHIGIVKRKPNKEKQDSVTKKRKSLPSKKILPKRLKKNMTNQPFAHSYATRSKTKL